MMQLSFFVFFFQAEDGIRDTSVTGVQTCALPILVIQKRHGHGRDDAAERARGAHQIPVPKPPALRTVTASPRCAAGWKSAMPLSTAARGRPVKAFTICSARAPKAPSVAAFWRSEERRVGKEG